MKQKGRVPCLRIRPIFIILSLLLSLLIILHSLSLPSYIVNNYDITIIDIIIVRTIVIIININNW